MRVFDAILFALLLLLPITVGVARLWVWLFAKPMIEDAACRETLTRREEGAAEVRLHDEAEAPEEHSYVQAYVLRGGWLGSLLLSTLLSAGVSWLLFAKTTWSSATLLLIGGVVFAVSFLIAGRAYGWWSKPPPVEHLSEE